MEKTIDEYYFYACEYMAKTELYDRTLTNERSPFDATSALPSNGRLRRNSYEYCLKLRKYFTEICGGTFSFIQKEINKHNHYTAQMWINEYYRLKEVLEAEEESESMTREEAIRIAQGLITDFKCESETMVEFCNVVIKALKQEPCEDAISRQETINYLNTNMAWYDEDGAIADSDEKLKAIADLINAVPPVTPQRKVGHWIEGKYKDTCDKCRCTYPKNIGFKKYCPNCGARMESEDDNT